MSSRGAGWSGAAPLLSGCSCIGCKRPSCLLKIFYRSHLSGVKSVVKCDSGAKKMPVIDCLDTGLRVNL